MYSTYLHYLSLAQQAMQYAYAPYSNFHVGACLVCQDGSVYTGCNIENASYGATVCAERTALFKAVSEGKRHFTLLAITSDSQSYTFPCGLCRQALSEFAPDLKILCACRQIEKFEIHSLSELLPHSFSKEGMNL